ncbi:hypothetical protein [Photobacterium leiognathi]|uniref:hypothetical protein n=1 Tax=Photobacterium leiognathi TaxID=553611 RepID=UPI002980D1FA|nr:hypothetical protein [Photobacterium leiognathi]
MKNLNFWLESFDKMRVERNPFKAHITADSLNEHEQNQYAVLQATFVLANGVINQDQERLYGFWLTAINNNLSLSNVITQAQAIDLDILRDGINLLEERGLVDHFLVDVLVFIRLAGGLSDNLKIILGEWCQLLSLNEVQLNDVITLTDHILAVKEPKPVKLTTTMELLLTNQIWLEFYVKPLTKETLTNSINGGIWLVEDTISTEYDINITNAVIMFKNTSEIVLKNSKLTLTNVGLINPIFNLYYVVMSFEQVVAVGGFDKEQKITSFISNSTPKFSIMNSKFELINARCFKFKDEEVNGLFESTTFKYCGNEYLNGGVISYKQGVKFKSCEFTECVAKIGGAIYAFGMLENTLMKCKVDNCYSFNENRKECGLYGEYFYSGAVKYSEILTTIVICNVRGDNLINNTRFFGFIEFKDNEESFFSSRTYSVLFDTETIKQSSIDSACNFMKKVSNIRRWSND